MNKNPLVGILMGSDNDYEIMKETAVALNLFGIPFEMTVSSAHRTPERTAKIVNTGGRVLGVTGLGSTVAEAIDCAYGAVDKINWDGVHFRKDIGQKALNR